MSLLLSFIVMMSSKPTTKPHIQTNKFNIPLFWKIANKRDFHSKVPKKFLFNDFPITMYKDYNNNITAISDICIHRGASLSRGKLLKNNCLQCPYHGWEYKNGLVENIPGCPDVKSDIFGVPRFEIKEENDDVYIRPTYDINSQQGVLRNHTIYIPPEAVDKSFVRISGSVHIKRPHNLVTENVLDMMHISYIHSFGNPISPVPFKIDYKNIDEFSGKTTFYYTAGYNSMSRLLGGAKFVIVENEFHLPDTTVTRVKANDLVKTIITHCYPVSKNESILHYDLYRNFLTNTWFDPLFDYQMKKTLDEDIRILYSIYDDYLLGFMNTKYDVTQMNYRKKVNNMMNRESN